LLILRLAMQRTIRRMLHHVQVVLAALNNPPDCSARLFCKKLNNLDFGKTERNERFLACQPDSWQPRRPMRQPEKSRKAEVAVCLTTMGADFVKILDVIQSKETLHISAE
ncbi:hypothetical protein, partial [Burkholderia glumae]|uniref:hypothetical protein n=2 Tax=Burkholderia glumae TaxID=337 RepID=UPI0011CFF3E9